MEIIKLGSIYLDSAIQTPGFSCEESEAISLGNTVPNQEITWVRLKNGVLIADRCICTNISWEQLNGLGFVFGTIVDIDSKKYMCRCLEVGAEESEPNEWDAALDEAGEGNELWHWKNSYFWGQETPKYNASSRAIRGYVSARFWNYRNAKGRFAYIGFRPALEPLGSVPCLSDTLVNKVIKAYFPGGVTIEGLLIDFTDYDIVLRPSVPLPAGFPLAVKDGCNIVVSRGNIIWLKEA